MLERRATDARDDLTYFQANVAGRSALLLGLGLLGFRHLVRREARNVIRGGARAASVVEDAAQVAARAVNLPAAPPPKVLTPSLAEVPSSPVRVGQAIDLDEIVRRQKAAEEGGV